MEINRFELCHRWNENETKKKIFRENSESDFVVIIYISGCDKVEEKLSGNKNRGQWKFQRWNDSRTGDVRVFVSRR